MCPRCGQVSQSFTPYCFCCDGGTLLGTPSVLDALRSENAALKLDVEAAKTALGGFVGKPFDGSLAGGIDALSMRCGYVEADLAACREELRVAKEQREFESMRHACTLTALETSAGHSVLEADNPHQSLAYRLALKMRERNAALEKALNRIADADILADGVCNLRETARAALARNGEGKPDPDLGTTAGL